MSNDIDGTAVSEGSEGDSDYAGDDSPFDESDYESSDDYEELEYDYELAEEPLPLEEVHCVPTFCFWWISNIRNGTRCVSSTSFESKSAPKTKFRVKYLRDPTRKSAPPPFVIHKEL